MFDDTLVAKEEAAVSHGLLMGHCAEALLWENDLATCHLSTLKMHQLL